MKFDFLFNIILPPHLCVISKNLQQYYMNHESKYIMNKQFHVFQAPKSFIQMWPYRAMEDALFLRVNMFEENIVLCYFYLRKLQENIKIRDL